MSKKNIKSKSANKNTIDKNISLAALLITIVFYPSVQDPFNSPKFWVLIIFTSYFFGKYFFNLRYSIQRFKFFSSLVLIFIMGQLIIVFLHYRNFYTSFFGETQRRLGFLSYFSLSILILITVTVNRISFYNLISKYVLFTLATVSTYGFLQHFGVDFVKWNNPYNSVISTVGNPNFSAALMGILLIVSFGNLLLKEVKKKLNFYFSLGICLISGITIYFSQARQGLLIMIFGILMLFSYKIYLLNHNLGKLVFSALIISSTFSILGMLKIGPLQNILYKPSVSVRGFYWRAALLMFRNQPLTGVGIDNYGSYFKQYREVNYSLNYGFDLTSTNAHNVFLQLLSTGGIFVGLSYLLLTLSTFVMAMSQLRRQNFANKNEYYIIFVAWLAFQAQSIISIDNFGVTIWGWIFMGMLWAGSYQNQSSSSESNESLLKTNVSTTNFASQQVFGGICLISSLILVSFLFQAERSTFIARSQYAPQYAQGSQNFERAAEVALSSKLLEPAYRTLISAYMLNYGNSEKALGELSTLVKNNPRNLDALKALAIYYLSKNESQQALSYLFEIEKYDPWNAQNYLQIGLIYKNLGDYDAMDSAKRKILSFASQYQIGIDAQNQLIKPK